MAGKATPWERPNKMAAAAKPPAPQARAARATESASAKPRKQSDARRLKSDSAFPQNVSRMAMITEVKLQVNNVPFKLKDRTRLGTYWVLAVAVKESTNTEARSAHVRAALEVRSSFPTGPLPRRRDFDVPQA